MSKQLIVGDRSHAALEGESPEFEVPSVQFAGLELPLSEAQYHMAMIGTTGSAKTTIFRLLMQSSLKHCGRALIYDAKGDMLSILGGFHDLSRVRTTHPFDARGCAWDIMQDVKEPSVALDMVCTLMPEIQETQPFFSNAARHLCYGVILSFMLSQVNWTLADVLRAMRDPYRLKKILRKHDCTEHIASTYLRYKRTLNDVLATLASKTIKLEAVVASWESARDTFSLNQWLADEESVLLLGNSHTSRAAMDAVNRCLFQRASALMLEQPETSEPRAWFWIDELSEAGKLDGLVPLLKEGRTKGVCVAIAFQTIAGLKHEQMYGGLCEDILGNIGSRFIGRQESFETAEWASNYIGEQEVEQWTKAFSWTKNYGVPTGGGPSHSTTSTLNQQIVTRRALLPSELMTIPPCDEVNGLSGFGVTRITDPFPFNIPGDVLFGQMLIPANPNVPAFVPRDVKTQYLRAWSEEQAAYFGAGPAREQKKRRAQEAKKKRAKRRPKGGDDWDDLGNEF